MHVATAAAVLLLTACSPQAPSPPPTAASPPRPVAKRVAPALPRPRPALQSEAARADRTARDREAQATCAYQGNLVADLVQDQEPSGLGLDSVLAGQSSRDTCLRSYRETGQVPGITP